MLFYTSECRKDFISPKKKEALNNFKKTVKLNASKTI